MGRKKIYNVSQDVSDAVEKKKSSESTKGEIIISTKGNYGKHWRQHAGWQWRAENLESGNPSLCFTTIDPG